MSKERRGEESKGVSKFCVRSIVMDLFTCCTTRYPFVSSRNIQHSVLWLVSSKLSGVRNIPASQMYM